MMRQVIVATAIVAIAGSAASAQMLSTAQPNNGRSDAGAGAFFDLTASTPIDVTEIRFFPNVALGGAVRVEIRLFNGSYVGHDGDPTGWVLHDTIDGISAGPAPAETPIVLNTPISIAAGQTVGVYFVNTLAGGVRYNGTATAPPQTTWMNAELTLFGERARGGPPFFGPLFTPRTFSGTIVYQAGGCYPDCDTSTGPGVLDIFDFLCFGNRFAANDPYACDCDTSTGPGVCDIFDFLCFGNAFSAGCP